MYLPDAVSLVGMGEEERATMLRLRDAQKSGEDDIRRHLIGQLKIVGAAIQYRRQQAGKKKASA